MRRATLTEEEKKIRHRQRSQTWNLQHKGDIRYEIPGFTTCEDCKVCDIITCRHNHNPNKKEVSL